MKMDFDWMYSCTEDELNSMIERASRILEEREKECAKSWLRQIRDCCFGLSELHMDVPVPGLYRNWEEVTNSFISILCSLE